MNSEPLKSKVAPTEMNVNFKPSPLTPIGTFYSSQKRPYEAGRQPDEHHAPGTVILEPQYEGGLQDLKEFTHVWLLFLFNHNSDFRLTVQPPRGSQKKVGVFACRSPYRPNFIGMSALRLEKIEKNILTVLGADLLNGTPILDIKPYIPEIDSIAEANAGWLRVKKFDISFTDYALEQLDYLSTWGIANIKGFIIHQLEFSPTDHKRKRVKKLPQGLWELGYQTWRIHFDLGEDALVIHHINSVYQAQELVDSTDKYRDKAVHLKYLALFPNR